MARSIGDWYADHADGRDGNADDEGVERQAPWDGIGSNRASRLGQSRRGRPKQNAKPTQSKLTAHQQRIRNSVLNARRAHPSMKLSAFTQLIRAQGIAATRPDVDAILRSTEPESRKKSPRKRESAARTAQREAAARPSNKRTVSQSELQERKAADEARRRAPRVPPRQPVKLAPMPLSLDQPKRRRVSHAGWRRAKIAVDAASPTPVAQPPMICNACGVVPTLTGECRCT